MMFRWSWSSLHVVFTYKCDCKEQCYHFTIHNPSPLAPFQMSSSVWHNPMLIPTSAWRECYFIISPRLLHSHFQRGGTTTTVVLPVYYACLTITHAFPFINQAKRKPPPSRGLSVTSSSQRQPC